MLAVIATVSVGVLAQPSQAQSPGLYISAGDSIAAGIGSSLPRERGNGALVTDWLATLTGQTVPFENLAVPGETAATFIENGQLQQLRETVERANAAGTPILAVSVSLGGNELLALEARGLSDRQAGLDNFRNRYGEAIAAIRDTVGPDTTIVVLTYYSLTGGDETLQFSDAWWIAQFNEAIRTVATGHGARVAETADPFVGRIQDFTHYPFDVHPTNAGHMEIARSIWQALGLDTDSPVLTVTSELVADRATPTIRFTVSDHVGVRSVSVTSDDAQVYGPYEVANGEYAVLLDAGAADAKEVALAIEISDDAGNVTSDVVNVQFADANRGETP